LTAREDRKEEHLGVRRALVDRGDDGLDAGGDLLGGVVGGTGVIGADHEHDGLGLNAFELAVLDAPEDVLGAVAADAEVGGLVLAELLVEDGGLATPAGGDGITEEDDLGFALLGDFDERLVRLEEAGLRLAVGSELRRGDIGGLVHGRSGRLLGGSLLDGSLLGLLGDEGGAADKADRKEEGQDAFHRVGVADVFVQPQEGVNAGHRCLPSDVPVR